MDRDLSEKIHFSSLRSALFVSVFVLSACGPMPQQRSSVNKPSRTLAQDPVVRVGALEKQLAGRGLDFEVRMKASFGEPTWNATWTEGSYASFDKTKANLEPIRGLLAAFAREAEAALKVMPIDSTVAAKTAGTVEGEDFEMDAEGSAVKAEAPVASSSPRARLQAQLDLVQNTLRNLDRFTQPSDSDLDTAAIALDRGQGQD